MYNQIYDFIINLGLEHSELVNYDGLRILDIYELELQIQENSTPDTVDYYDNLILCDQVYNVSYDTITDLILNRIGVI